MKYTNSADVFAALSRKFDAEAAAGSDAVFQFLISGPRGGQWSVAVQSGQCQIAEGVHASPNLTVSLSDEHWLKLANRELSAMNAYLTGKLKAQGDVFLATQMGKLFGF